MNINNIPQEQLGDSPELTDKLAQLIVDGIKTATCSAYTPDKDKIKTGAKTVILNSQNTPVCVIETTKTDVIPFNKITKDFARKEGEGDRSLEYWRAEHKRFFEAEGMFSEDMLLFCETFRVVHVFK